MRKFFNNLWCSKYNKVWKFLTVNPTLIMIIARQLINVGMYIINFIADTAIKINSITNFEYNQIVSFFFYLKWSLLEIYTRNIGV